MHSQIAPAQSIRRRRLRRRRRRRRRVRSSTQQSRRNGVPLFSFCQIMCAQVYPAAPPLMIAATKVSPKVSAHSLAKRMQMISLSVFKQVGGARFRSPFQFARMSNFRSQPRTCAPLKRASFELAYRQSKSPPLALERPFPRGLANSLARQNAKTQTNTMAPRRRRQKHHCRKLTAIFP